MYQLRTIFLQNPTIGQTVEIRELNMKAFMQAQREAAGAGDEDTIQTSLRYLSRMLWVDGRQFTMEEIEEFPAGIVMELIGQMNELFGGAGEGEA